MDESAAQPQTSEQPQPVLRELRFRNSWKDWALRTLTFIVFLFFASGKFKSGADAPWVLLFAKIGFGQWLRYFTGAVEIAGAFLVLTPRTVELGLALLSAVMLGAMAINIFVLHALADAFLPFAFTCGMISLYLHRRRV